MFAQSDALQLDNEDALRHMRSEFIYPTKGDLKSNTLAGELPDPCSSEPSLYLCGNSLGLQPQRTVLRVQQHLTAWAKKGVTGHFTKHEDSGMEGFLNLDAQAAEMMAPLVGAQPDEVAIAETLTANLHLLMASFYKPTQGRYKIIIEGKAFPSDYYAVESQIIHHGYDPKQAMVCIGPMDSTKATMTTAQILSIIDEHASIAALILLPGVQYFTGQFLDIRTITSHAHSHGIMIGWDLAHAVGNVELLLHDWDADFAVWCNYKYVNAGPGSIAGLFVNAKHGTVDRSALGKEQRGYRSRLAGWWGGDKAVRFEMAPHFVPIAGAQGFQVGNPSALAMSALIASLEIFHLTSMSELRKKSTALTGYMERLLLESPFAKDFGSNMPYSIITPPDPEERGAQLSIHVKADLLETVLSELEAASVVVDERKPDVVRVAPAPLYNTFEEVWNFVRIFTAACKKAQTQADTVSER